MRLAVMLLIFTVAASCVLPASSIGTATIFSSAGNPLPNDSCQQSASGTSISLSCVSDRSGQAVATALANISVSFGSLSLVAVAGGSGGDASVFASASYDEFLLFGNNSLSITGQYFVLADETGPFNFSLMTINQGGQTFSANGLQCCDQMISLTSDYTANVPMEVSAAVFSNPSTPGNEGGQFDIRLVGFSAPFTLVTPEPSTFLLIGAGLLLVVVLRSLPAADNTRAVLVLVSVSGPENSLLH